ncbi:hypothetical protein F7725_002600 [Dissostichus mawsoni]|uniref:Uncharacterized protein n=1 Tax=Dissostichus mawsoni TaxID=36200 RepID=A0A7J5Y3Z1_DISMA|nr:hypothetical protein F7725_002600 [Dissostichus mawsoni]
MESVSFQRRYNCQSLEMKRRLLLVSNSTLHGSGYLDHCQGNISHFFGRDVKRVLFVPYALHDRDAYTKTARDKFNSLGWCPLHGSSAGTNVATVSINTTNDMPIVVPALLLRPQPRPLQHQPPLLDPDPHSRHMGESREQRITQYHEEPDTPSVLGLREGSLLLVEGNKATLLGTTRARLFTRGKPTVDYDPGSDLSFLLTH